MKIVADNGIAKIVLFESEDEGKIKEEFARMAEQRTTKDGKVIIESVFSLLGFNRRK